MPPLPTISTLPSLPPSHHAHILDILFEPCTQLHTLSVAMLREATFPDYTSLISAIQIQLTRLLDSPSNSDGAWLDAILSAHPRLGEKKVEGELSRQEQAQLQGEGERGERLTELNEEYESAFPGLRYVVFVHGRSRHLLMEDMERRVNRNNARQERQDAIQAICDIALDRVGKLGEESEA